MLLHTKQALITIQGPTVMLIGIALIKSGFQNWSGGSELCSAADPLPFFASCPDITAPHALPWGSPEFLGKHLTFVHKEVEHGD